MSDTLQPKQDETSQPVDHLAIYNQRLIEIDERERNNFESIHELQKEIKRRRNTGYVQINGADIFLASLKRSAKELPQAVRNYSQLYVDGFMDQGGVDIARVGLSSLNAGFNATLAYEKFFEKSLLIVPTEYLNYGNPRAKSTPIATLAEFKDHTGIQSVRLKAGLEIQEPYGQRMLDDGEDFVDNFVYPALRPASAIWVEASAVFINPNEAQDFTIPEYLKPRAISPDGVLFFPTSDVLTSIAQDFTKRAQRKLTEDEFIMLSKVLGSAIDFVIDPEKYFEGEKEPIFDDTNTIDHLASIISSMTSTSHNDKLEAESRMGQFALNTYSKNVWRMIEDLLVESFKAIEEPIVISKDVDSGKDIGTITQRFNMASFLLGEMTNLLSANVYKMVMLKGIVARESEGIDRVRLLKGISRLEKSLRSNPESMRYYRGILSLQRILITDFTRAYSGHDVNSLVGMENESDEEKLKENSHSIIAAVREYLARKKVSRTTLQFGADDIVKVMNQDNLQVPIGLLRVEVDVVKESSSVPITFVFDRNGEECIIKSFVTVNPEEDDSQFELIIMDEDKEADKHLEMFSAVASAVLRNRNAEIGDEKNAQTDKKKEKNHKKARVKTRGLGYDVEEEEIEATEDDVVYKVRISPNLQNEIDKAKLKPKSRLATIGINDEYLEEVLNDVKRGSKKPQETRALAKFGVPIYYIRIGGGRGNGRRFLFYYDQKNDEYILEDCFKRGNSSEFDQFVDNLARRYL